MLVPASAYVRVSWEERWEGRGGPQEGAVEGFWALTGSLCT